MVNVSDQRTVSDCSKPQSGLVFVLIDSYSKGVEITEEVEMSIFLNVK